MPKKTVNIHRQNPPQWFRDAGFGIFIHWGLYSVPAYAPVEAESFDVMVREKTQEYLFQNQPYAEWYKNSIAIDGSPAQAYHREHYGDMPYEDFALTFRETAKNADPAQWADCFCKAGAKYVVLVSKHHDGFVLFNSKLQNPNIANYMLDFDFTGQLAAACRKKGLRFGVYYSSLLDWTFTQKPVINPGTLLLGNDNSRRYTDYCYGHWMEIIERYRPDILWSDIGYPADRRLPALFDAYYNAVPDGLVNDRWVQMPNILRSSLGIAAANAIAKKVQSSTSEKPLPAKYYDYRTLEYTDQWTGSGVWFESCRGMDKSFAYNKFSRAEDYITVEEVHRLIRNMHTQRSKKGRLLLNVGPDENGVIPEYQQVILTGLQKSVK